MELQIKCQRDLELQVSLQGSQHEECVTNLEKQMVEQLWNEHQMTDGTIPVQCASMEEKCCAVRFVLFTELVWCAGIMYCLCSKIVLYFLKACFHDLTVIQTEMFIFLSGS